MAANTTATMLLPNPLTPLAFLPPALADEFQVTSYVNVASLAVSINARHLPRLIADMFKM